VIYSEKGNEVILIKYIEKERRRDSAAQAGT
jgi:hypothetical protein